MHNLPQADITPTDPKACLGDSAHITAHNGQSYQWLNAASISNPSVADPYVYPAGDTKYTVLVTDSYGCQNTDSVLVKITQPQTLSVSSPVNVCYGNKAYFSASGTDVYNWIDGDDLNSTSIPNPATTDTAEARSYTVVGSDADGCFSQTATVDVIIRDNPIVDAGASQVVPAGTSVQLSATATTDIVKWNWDPSVNLSCINCASPVSKLKTTTLYTAEATNSYGCKGSDTVKISVLCKESLVDVPQAFTPNNDGLNDKLRVLAQGVKSITHFVIYDRSGYKVFERNNVNPFSNEASWDGMNNGVRMPPGTYVYIIEAVCEASADVYHLKGTVTLIR